MKRATIAILASGLVGMVFGIGLIVSGMFNPAKVLAFLDLAGPWDPSLALVMAGAVTIAAMGFALARRRGNSWLGSPLQLGSARSIDRRLILGSLVFGVGWGLVGFCPGPALVALGTGEFKAVVFLVSMLAGMLIFEELERRRELATHRAQEPMQSSASDG
jgi:uncharacterized membrane protein YedE/YeeE